MAVVMVRGNYKMQFRNRTVSQGGFPL